MAIVVRLGPLPLGRRRPSRVVELERIFPAAVEIVEVFDAAALAAAMEMDDVLAVALDASGPEELAGAVLAAGHGPMLRPLWRPERNSGRRSARTSRPRSIRAVRGFEDRGPARSVSCSAS